MLRNFLVCLSFLAIAPLKALSDEPVLFELIEKLLPGNDKFLRTLKDVLDEVLPVQPDVDHKLDLPTDEMIEQEGYPAEKHIIQTDDGYILKIFRIPSSPLYSGDKVKGTILLQHGIVAASDDWVILGKGKALAYLLADLGYDVWLGNSRGNTYSRNHTTLSPSDDKFWNFTIHEMALHDLPAMIDYITQNMKGEKLAYIGHSMGTSTFFILASLRQDVAQKVHAMIALAPVAYCEHIQSFFRLLVPFVGLFEIGFEIFGHGEVLPRNPVLETIKRLLCDESKLEEIFCSNIAFGFFGFDPAHVDLSIIPVYTGHYPGGASVKTLTHLAQLVQSGKFRPYDYGMMKNQEHYNSDTPPDYDLSSITVPITLIYADNDSQADPKDVDRLDKELTVKHEKYRVNSTSFSHIDFMIGTDAPTLLYGPVISRLESYFGTAD